MQRIPKDPKKAKDILDRSCQYGSFKACDAFSRLILFEDAEPPEEVTRAVKILRSTCEAGYPRACSELGDMYDDSEPYYHGPKDWSLAVSYSEKGCEGKDFGGCLHLASLYRWGKQRNSRIDMKKTVEAYLKACDLFTRSCGFAADVYHDGGAGLAQDDAKAAALYRRACDAKDGQACLALSGMYRDGRGGLSKDPSLAKQLAERACSEAIPELSRPWECKK